MDETAIAEVGEIINRQKTSIWTIKNAIRIFDTDTWAMSPLFYSNEMSWQLVMIPKGYSDEKGEYMSFFLRLRSKSEHTTNYSVAIMDKENKSCYERICGVRNYIRKKNYKGPGNKYYAWGIANFIQTEEFLEKKDYYMPKNNLVIMVELYKSSFNIYNRFPYTFEDIINNKANCDVTLIVQIEKNFQYLYAHKSVLLKSSRGFTDVYAKSLDYGKSDTAVLIEGFAYEVIVEMLRFIYTGEVKNMENLWENMANVALKYDIPQLRDVCDNFLYQKLTADNAEDYLLIAERYNLISLKENAQDRIDSI